MLSIIPLHKNATEKSEAKNYYSVFKHSFCFQEADFEMAGFLTNFQNFSRVFRPTGDLFRVVVDRINRVFNNSGTTWADLIYQRSSIKNRVKHTIRFRKHTH